MLPTQACLKEMDNRMTRQCEQKGETVEDVEDKRTPLINFIDFCNERECRFV